MIYNVLKKNAFAVRHFGIMKNAIFVFGESSPRSTLYGFSKKT